LKDNVPVAEAGVTVAVSVMDCPDTAVVAEPVKVTAVVCKAAAPLTWTDTALDVDDWSAVSPAYEAVMLWVPAASDEMFKVAAPFVREAVPSDAEPSIKVMVPEGADPVVAATTTLKVTDCPTLICVADAERLVVVLTAVETFGCTTNNTAE
jgi:hypothetical protein